MKEALVNHSGDTQELDKIWDGFLLMQTLGYIDLKTWKEFCDQCAGWYVDEETWSVRDERRENALVWDYAQGRKYEA